MFYATLVFDSLLIWSKYTGLFWLVSYRIWSKQISIRLKLFSNLLTIRRRLLCRLFFSRYHNANLYHIIIEISYCSRYISIFWYKEELVTTEVICIWWCALVYSFHFSNSYIICFIVILVLMPFECNWISFLIRERIFLNVVNSSCAL